MRNVANAEVLFIKYYKGETNYRAILMQVTHEKCKGVGVFVKQFFDG